MDDIKPVKSIGELIDELYIARAERIKLEAEVNAQKAVEKQTRELKRRIGGRVHEAIDGQGCSRQPG